MKLGKNYLLPAVLLLSMFSLGIPLVFAASFTTFDVPGFEGRTTPLGINAQGQIVGMVGSHGFLLDHGTFTLIDVPGASETQARGINDKGQIVGLYFDGQSGGPGRHGFLLDHGIFTTIDMPGSTTGLLDGINDKGQIVGSFSGGVFLLDHGHFTNVPTLIDAFAINARGEIVGDAVQGGSCVLDNGAVNIIDVPGSVANTTRALRINNRGQVVGFYFFDTHHGFLFDHGRFTTIDVPGAVATELTGINGAGHIVGFFNDAGGQHGFVAIP
jgi:uncharacterized membrane protein